MAAQTSHTKGPDQSRTAAGRGTGSHGSKTTALNRSGFARSDDRQNTQASATEPATSAASHQSGGSNPTRTARGPASLSATVPASTTPPHPRTPRPARRTASSGGQHG